MNQSPETEQIRFFYAALRARISTPRLAKQIAVLSIRSTPPAESYQEWREKLWERANQELARNQITPPIELARCPEWIAPRPERFRPAVREVLELVYGAELPTSRAAEQLHCSTRRVEDLLDEARQSFQNDSDRSPLEAELLLWWSFGRDDSELVELAKKTFPKVSLSSSETQPIAPLSSSETNPASLVSGRTPKVPWFFLSILALGILAGIWSVPNLFENDLEQEEIEDRGALDQPLLPEFAPEEIEHELAFETKIATLPKKNRSIESVEDPDTNQDPARNTEEFPWSRTHDELVSFSDSLHRDFGEFSGIRIADLERWFDRVPGRPSQFHEQERHLASISAFEGVVRLRPEWKEDSVLRLNLFDHNRLRIRFIKGNQEHLLIYYEDASPRFCLYQVHHDPTGKNSYRLLATDSQRLQKGPQGPFEIRFHNRTLVLNRRDFVVLRFPGEGKNEEHGIGPPDEVLFENRAWFRGISLYRGEPVPSHGDQPEAGSPLRMGPLAISADGPKDVVRETIPLPKGRFQEVTFRIDQATPATCVTFLNARGEQMHQLSFSRETRSNGMVFSVLHPGDRREETNSDPEERVSYHFEPGTWFKMIAGIGIIKCYFSVDGQSWSPIEEPGRGQFGIAKSLALIAWPTNRQQVLRLSELSCRELSGLREPWSNELLRSVPEMGHHWTIQSWMAQVLESQPEEIEDRTWRMAAAVSTLESGSNGNLGNQLAYLLWLDSFHAPWEENLRGQFQHNLLTISDHWEGWETVRWLYPYFRYQTDQGATALSAWKKIVDLPILSTKFPDFPSESIARDLVRMAASEEFDELRPMIPETRSWVRKPHPDIWVVPELQATLDWAAKCFPDQSPLESRTSREAHAFFSEVQQAVQGGALEEASRVVISAPVRLRGLETDLIPSEDLRLDYALRTAFQKLYRTHPEFLVEFGKLHSRTGDLLIEQSLQSGDREALEWIAETNPGAYRAALFLGEDDLANGRVLQALRYFQRAQENQILAQGEGTRSGETPIEPRIRLARAFLGMPEFGSPITEPVQVGASTFEPSEFETRLNKIRDKSTRTNFPRIDSPIPPLFETGAKLDFELEKTIPFTGEVGLNADHPSPPGIDRTGREYSLARWGNVVLWHNRFQLTAFDSQSGNLLWSKGLGDRQGEARQHSHLPFHPMLSPENGTIFVRRFLRSGPEIYALRLSDGETLWTVKIGDYIATDPIFAQSFLYTLALEPTALGQLKIDLVRIDPTSGELRERNTILEVRDEWNRNLPCVWQHQEGVFVVAIEGLVASFDLSGKVIWSRSVTWVPPSIGTSFEEIARQPPWISGNRVFVTQPGMNAVACLSLAEGTLLWQRGFRDLRSVINLTETLCILEMSQGLMALDRNEGTIRWRRELYPSRNLNEPRSPGPILYSASLIERSPQDQKSDPVILCFGATPIGPDRWGIEACWIEPRTGEIRARALLNSENLTDPLPYIGPGLFDGERLWLGYGRGDRSPNRDLLLLKPVRTPATTLASRSSTGLDHWSPITSDRLRAQLFRWYPGWTVLSHQPERETGEWINYRGSPRVMATRGSRNEPFLMTRKGTSSIGSIRFRVTSGNSQPHQIELRNGPKTIWATLVPGDAEWHDYEIVVSSPMERGIQLPNEARWLTLRHHPLDGTGDLVWASFEETAE